LTFGAMIGVDASAVHRARKRQEQHHPDDPKGTHIRAHPNKH